MSSNDELALPILDCWNSIGVKGDQSCPELIEHIHCHNCPKFSAAAQAFLDRPAPEGYLGEMTGFLAESASLQSAHDDLSVVIFEVEDQVFAVETRTVVEVTEPRAAHRIPHRSGRVFVGIVNVHGQLEPCASLKGLLQIASEGSNTEARLSTARMLMLEHRGHKWVFGVDRAQGVHRFALADVLDVPATTLHNSASYIKKVLRWQGRRVGLLDLDKTFDALERSLR